MKLRPTLALALLASLASPLFAEDVKPLRVLIVAGGCCHDYANQKEILKKGLEARLNVKVEMAYDATKGTKPVFEIYKKADWHKDFDVVVHDECAADITDAAYVENILKAHREGVPAVNLHCAMHSYRIGPPAQPAEAGSERAMWFEFLGLQSSGHGPKLPLTITFDGAKSPIVRGMAEWTTGPEELYNNIQVLPTATVLARAKQTVKEKVVEAAVVWTNDYKGVRVFNTTIGHNNETVGDARYLDLVTRGLLWSCKKLGDDGKPAKGYGPVAAK